MGAAYEYVAELARGGMGMVDLVLKRQGRFERLYARKRLLFHLREEEGIRTMFLDEARLAGLVHHPNVVSVLDVGEDEEGPFLIMDYIEGVSLSRFLQLLQKSGRLLPTQVALRIGAHIAAGLHAVHDLVSSDGNPLELVHRDVTPQNVLVGADGICRLTDFGIAKALDQTNKTSTGILKGKMGYMSPEQLRYEAVDRRSDLFALGIVLYETLTCERVYPERKGDNVPLRILNEPPPDLRSIRPDAPLPIVQLLNELMSKQRDQRPPNAAAVLARLEPAIQALVEIEGQLHIADEVNAYCASHMEAERTRIRTGKTPRPENNAKTVSIRPRVEDSLSVEMVITPDPSPAEATVDGPLRRPGRRWVMSLGVLAMVGVGVGAWQAGWLGDPPAAAPPQAAAAPAEVTLRIETEPSGAEVLVDGNPRGMTPLALTWPRGDAPISLAVSLAGYEAITEQARPDLDQRLRFRLTPVTKPTPVVDPISAVTSTEPKAAPATSSKAKRRPPRGAEKPPNPAPLPVVPNPVASPPAPVKPKSYDRWE